MILGAEIGLFIYGLIAIIRGIYSMGKGQKVIGPKARLLGALCMAPIPLSMMVGIVIGLTNPEGLASGELRGLIAGIEITILVATFITVTLLAKKFIKEQEEKN